MGGLSVKVGILTSSRADYGIYLPLLRAIQSDPFFEMHLLVFGSHLSEKFGYTASQIESDGFKISHRLCPSPENDAPGDIVKSMAKTMITFTELWERESFDLIIALGDRYEMFSAVSSTVPFNISVAHIHGGETTLGAIDNVFRHSLTSMSKLHFTSCEEYKSRVVEIKGSEKGVYNVGALSYDTLAGMHFFTVEEFYEKYKIDLEKQTILFTFHPETISYKKNEEFIQTLIELLGELKKYQIVITMPNADTAGNIIRVNLKSFIKNRPNVFCIESFGSAGYLSCMKYCSFMLGNTSSGFVEASWFPKPVINVGERQKGRILTSNIISCGLVKKEIVEAIKRIEKIELKSIEKHYGDGNTSQRIKAIIKNLTL